MTTLPATHLIPAPSFRRPCPASQWPGRNPMDTEELFRRWYWCVYTALASCPPTGYEVTATGIQRISSSGTETP
jgi:hypothetical protein